MTQAERDRLKVLLSKAGKTPEEVEELRVLEEKEEAGK